MEDIIEKILLESIKTKEIFIRDNVAELIMLSEKIVHAFTNDRKLMICGNGGSAADAHPGDRNLPILCHRLPTV